MKIYISADIEGITGITHWDETEKSKPDYQKFSKQMTDEVKAACEGAINAGAEEIWIKDAHDTGRNIIASDLPQIVRLVRGLERTPLKAFKASFYPGMKQISSTNVVFETDNYFEVLRMLLFAI